MKRFLKDLVKKSTGTLGFEITRRNIHRSTRTGVLEHIERLGFKPETIIDVGAAYGTFDLYEIFPTAACLLIEPLEEFEDALKAVTRKFKAIYVLAAAGAEPGMSLFNVHPDLVGSSLYRESEGTHADGVPREVPMVTLDIECNERMLKGPI